MSEALLKNISDQLHQLHDTLVEIKDGIASINHIMKSAMDPVETVIPVHDSTGACPSCDSSQVSIAQSDEGKFYKCRNCDLVWTN